MDLQTVLNAVQTWSPGYRLRLIDRIWNGLIGEGHDFGLTDA